MNETQKRIKAYKEALPGLRERVVAVALLLAMSAAMMTSASFAWLTISRRPELTGVSTTVAANGNLEIALVSPDGNRPNESQVGDSSATKGQSVVASNITWGNLVNLSDPAYGLEKLTLRPAQLNTASLLESPLYGAVYGQDGRITQLSSSFAYAIWNPPAGEKPGYFGVSDDYGVRAISSTTVQAVGAEAMYFNMVKAAKDKNLLAANTYSALGNNSNYMPSLATMMGLYMTARMNPDSDEFKNPVVDIKDIQNLRDMYAAFLNCFDLEADAMAAMVNLQLFLKHGDGNYTPWTAADIYNATEASLKQQGLFIEKLDQFKRDRATIASDYEKLVVICNSGQNLTWTDTGLNQIVNNLVNVGQCTIGANNTPISSIGASNAANYIGKTQEARITNGILLRFEERTGGYIEVKNLVIKASIQRGILVLRDQKVTANIKTTASREYNLFTNDLQKTEAMNDGDYAGGIPVAEDTYGLAIDLWVRTNAAGSYLTLEGNVLTESEWVRATTTDTHGNKVDVFTVEITVESEDGVKDSYTIDVYKGKATVQNQDGSSTEQEVWFNADNHAIVSAEELGDAEPAPKMVEVIKVIGYEGENRVWGDNNTISVDATTQGSGSCYVYYADTPEDQARSLRLLEAFNVAFVDEEGRLLATAIMDTSRYYATSGRVIVPLVLEPSSSIDLGEDSQGNVTYAITALEQNVPTRITAIVYLDGTKLTNQEVLAAADIQGQLNIQFGSSQNLNPVVDTTLQDATRKVTASVSVNEFDYDTATGPMTTRVTVHVDGEQPSSMTAFFMRSINATQGSRESTMTFTQGENGDWHADYTFTAPGTYVLRSVRLDGVDYDLPDTSTTALPKVVVSGFAIDYLNCTQANEQNHVNIMSAANSTTLNLSMKFVADDPDKMPTTVVGRYIHDENGSAVNVDFTFNPTTQIWSGEATFYSSGEYTLQYLVLDGEYVELVAPQYDEQGNLTSLGQWQTARITLGMRVRVYTNSPRRFKFVPTEMADNEKMLAMQVEIVDNTGKLMPGLTDVWLTYGMKDSGVKVMQTALTWNGTYYVGELPAITGGPGIWQFSNVNVDGSTLTYAEQYPIFTIMSPEPPAYVGHTTVANQFSPDNKATMNARITNSDAASVRAFIQRSNGTDGVWVTGVKKNDFTTEDGKPGFNWEFSVPIKDGYQDGNWVMTQLEIWDVFDAEGNAYTEEDPLVVDVKDNNITKVVARIYVEFATDRSQNFGKDAGGNVTGKFMDGYTISGLDVVVKDFEGNPIPGIKDVKLSFVYGNNSVSYGGYSGPDNSTADFIITLADDGSGTHFVQPADKPHTIRFAGSYSTTFSFVISRSGQGDQLISFSGDNLPANAPKYTVSSVTPTITLKSTTNYAGSSTNGSTITVAYGHSTETTCGITYHNYQQPNVVFTLSGYGNASGAALIFQESGGGDVRLYVNKEDADNKRTDRYSWTADGDCTRWVGFWNSQTGSDRTTNAGTIKATHLTLTFDGVNYQVDIEDITIINPVAPT